MIELLENINEITTILLFLCGYVYMWSLKKMKRERKLSRFEATMYIVVSITTFLFAVSYLLLIFQ